MIGLILGDTKLPFEVLKKVKKKKLKYLIIDLTKKKIFKKNKYSFSVSIGQIGKILNILKSHKCHKILFAGKVEKPNFSRLRLDLKGFYYIPRIIKSSKLGDAALLKEIIKIFKKENINTLNSLNFNPDLSLKKGNYSKTKPNKNDIINIKIAISTLKTLNKYNFSQAAIIRDKKVDVIEDVGGTRKMLKISKNKRPTKKGILIKFPKEKQDLRIDLPTVGIETFRQCKNAKINGVVLKHKQNVFLDKNKCISYANKNKMFITVK